MEKTNAEHRTVLVTAFEGWNDAGCASSLAVRTLIEHTEALPFTEVDDDFFYDYRDTRPQQCTALGFKRIVWPSFMFYRAIISPELTLLLAVGPEPNLHWRDFCTTIVGICEDEKVDLIVNLASIYESNPYTRNIPIGRVDGSDLSINENTYTGPVGITTILNLSAAQQGQKSLSLWADVPEYLPFDQCPPATLALMRSLCAEVGVESMKGMASVELATQMWTKQANNYVEQNPALAQSLSEIEHNWDVQQSHQQQKVAASELVDEAERFLRSYDRCDWDAEGRTEHTHPLDPESLPSSQIKKHLKKFGGDDTNQ
ncbi:MAG TPA: PAC2 family protein [Aeriscardovia aeriphila]|uniref:PAC2 family protein n=1 Tax=Aeriscardovia aeriphila TaxID=218139 RepID=A0A921FUP5_9BIFI|nr:PAC2 family protein [Aeriscardovia aeriphila]